ncbi:serine peptidase [candidate division WOR-3 bacterium]|nr:serine peptidase [candidate division WOR-3 bacterium]
MRKRSTKAGGDVGRMRVVYVHGIGAQPKAEVLKRDWDLALFGKEMGAQTKMAYWADILHPGGPAVSTKAVRSDSSFDIDALLREAGVAAENDDVQRFSLALASRLGVQVAAPGGMRAASVQKKILPLPAAWRRPLARAFLERFVKDTAAYFFKPGIRDKARKALNDLLKNLNEPVTIVAHSQGTIITLEVLAAERSRLAVAQLVTLGSPLGITEVQDFLSCPLRVPAGVAQWHNFADRFDPVALDKGLGNDFRPGGFITDRVVSNLQARRLEGFNPHAASGYLALPEVREVVYRAARYDTRARFLVARDVAADLAVEARHSVLVEILEPGAKAVDEDKDDKIRKRVQKANSVRPSLAARVEHAAAEIGRIVEEVSGKDQVDAARIDRLRRFVSASLTPDELSEVAHKYPDLHIYRVWKSNVKRKLLTRSCRAIQADAAWASYRAFGKGITWAVLDTGANRNHPHLKDNVVAVWDCTRPGAPTPVPAGFRDPDGHGTHVAGIIAGASDKDAVRGIAPQAKLVVYKVLDENGAGEDAWIIKALDHVAEQNENMSSVHVQGLNLSLGGPYDSTVYGCGFTPICTELRRLWRSGVLVVVASGNEGQVEVSTPDGTVELNSPMSIGDPANLEECIAVGAVSADSPHLYGVSAFSSRGPTSDGRVKPDVVAPGERISSCNSGYTSTRDLYREESGTSMAAPHVSGLLAAFLSVRREFIGRPDEVKAILLRTCTDIGRDRYHQGHGVPNLMKMLLET